MSTSYFSHDSNARNDEKLIRLRMKHGAAGYGVFFMLLERLRDEANYTSIKDYNVIAFDLRVDASLIKDVVENFGLFSFTDDGKCFYSESFNARMSLMDAAKNKRAAAGKKGAAKRWGNDAIAKPSENNSNAIAKPSESDGNKTNKTKLNKNKTNTTRQKSASRTFAEDSEEYKSALHLWRRIQNNNHDAKAPDLQKWSDELRLMHERDNRPWNKINRMIDWCQDDDFWQANILSPVKLRKQYDQMAAKANANAKHSKQNYGRQHRQEDTPDWMQPGYKPESKPTTPEAREKLDAAFEELKKMREAKANGI